MMVKTLSGARLPARISDLDDPPDRVYLAGTLPPGPVVAIVGTRHPSPQASKFAHEISYELARRGVVVASGGALGVDSAAHRGALAAGAGTLVVAPASLDRAYPEVNRDLFQQVLNQNGGYLSLSQAETPATRTVFFARNRLLVALASAVVLIEAPVRSGARNAALWARKLGRPLFVVPSPPWHARGFGGLLELKLGATPLSSHKDVLNRLAQLNQHPVDPGLDAAPPALNLQLPFHRNGS